MFHNSILEQMSQSGNLAQFSDLITVDKCHGDLVLKMTEPESGEWAHLHNHGARTVEDNIMLDELDVVLFQRLYVLLN